MWYDNLISTHRLTALANLVLLTLAAYFAVGLFYQIAGAQLNPPASFEQAKAVAESQVPLKDRPFAYYRPVMTRDLFKTLKTAVAKPDTRSVDLEALEQTQLKLKLWGTVSGDAQNTYAVIEDLQKREQNLYRVGDSIQDATVKVILREKVVLAVAGKDEVLAMEEITQGSSPSPRAIASSRGPQPFPSRATREQKISIRRSMIDESLKDVNKLMTEIAIRPHEDGLSLSNIKPNSVFRRMGLRNGDVLVGINGQEIRSVEDAMRLYEGLRSASDLQVQLKRRGRDRSISYNIR